MHRVIVCRLLNIKSINFEDCCVVCVYSLLIFFLRKRMILVCCPFPTTFLVYVASFFFITSTIFIYNNAGSFSTRDDVQAILIHLSDIVPLLPKQLFLIDNVGMVYLLPIHVIKTQNLAGSRVKACQQ